jgi:hypothetical protein
MRFFSAFAASSFKRLALSIRDQWFVIYLATHQYAQMKLSNGNSLFRSNFL